MIDVSYVTPAAGPGCRSILTQTAAFATAPGTLMSDTDTDAARRAYWTEQFDAAYHFMFEQVLPYPVAECGEPMVSLQQAAEQADVVVQFSTRPHALGLPRLFYLRDGQIPGFIGAAAEMNERGWVMRVEDGYRTPQMQKHLGRMPQVFDAVLKSVMWELGGQRPTPEFMFRRCSTLVASVPKFGTHMSGSAIDISVMHLDDPTREVDRGAPYLEMSALTPMGSPFVSDEARQQPPRHHRTDAPPRLRRLSLGVLALLQRRRLRAGAGARPAGRRSMARCSGTRTRTASRRWRNPSSR